MKPRINEASAFALMLLAVAALTPSISACREDKAMDLITVSRRRLQAIPQNRWDALAQKRIYFGHQSVGQNILEGLRAVLAATPGIRLDLHETSDPRDFDRPIFAHSPIGQNSDPRGKIDHFRSILESGIGLKADAALFKFCYVDIDPSTDLQGLMDHYDRALSELGANFPRLTILAVTVPLTNTVPGIKSRIKGLLGKGAALREENARRNVINDHIRKKYGEALWDLAAVETMTAKGGRVLARGGLGMIELLNPAYTSDGGHLNEVGSQVVAIDLLVRLVGLEGR